MATSTFAIQNPHPKLEQNVQRLFADIFELQNTIKNFEKTKNIKLKISYCPNNFSLQNHNETLNTLASILDLSQPIWQEYLEQLSDAKHFDPSAVVKEVWTCDTSLQSPTCGQFYLQSFLILSKEEALFVNDPKLVASQKTKYARLNGITPEDVTQYLKLLAPLFQKYQLLENNKLWSWPQHFNLVNTISTLLTNINQEELFDQWHETFLQDQESDQKQQDEQTSDSPDNEQPIETIEQQLLKPSGNKPICWFDFTKQQQFEQILKQQFPQQLSIWNNFFNIKKQIFPLLDAKLSLFDLFILQALVGECLSNPSALAKKYKLSLEIDPLFAPANVSAIWNLKARKYNTTLSQDENYLIFPNKKVAIACCQDLMQALKTTHNKLKRVKMNRFILKEQPFIPYQDEDLFLYPLFSFNNKEDLLAYVDALTTLINNQQVAIKDLNLSQQDTIAFFQTITNNLQKVLTTKELKIFKFLTPDQAYLKLTKYFSENDNKTSFLVPTSFDLLPKNISQSVHCYKVYELIYYSWIKFLIPSCNQIQFLQKYMCNMFQFFDDTKIFAKNSPFCFRSELFLTYIPYTKQPKIDPLNNFITIKKSKPNINEIDGFSLTISQLNLLFHHQVFNWKNCQFVFDSLLNLITNNLIFIDKKTITFSPLLEEYVPTLQSPKISKFSQDLKQVFLQFFDILVKLPPPNEQLSPDLTNEISQFLQQLDKIIKKPF